MKDKILNELVILAVAIMEGIVVALPFILYHFLGIWAIVGYAIGIFLREYKNKRKEFYDHYHKCV